MSVKDNSIINSTTSNRINMPLKASVVLVSAMLMAACGTNGTQSYNLDDVFGNSDIVYEPKTPTTAEFSGDGTKLTGIAEENAIVKVKDKQGNVLGSAVANAKGEFEVTLKAPLTKGQEVEVEAYYPNATRPSDPLEVTAPTIEDTDEQTDPTGPTDPTDPTQPNEPEAEKSGVQTLNVNVAPLNQVFKTTTRDFTADDSSVVARADLASNDLLGQLTITTSGEGDTEVAGSNGFKAHEDNAEVEALGQKLPLTYTSTYKDFGDNMRIGHIDGKAVFSGAELPVNGAAVIGNATKAENMPKEGSVDYTGDATYRKLGIGNEIEYGTSAFTADFVAKSVKGDLSFANAGDIALSAEIDGNKFSGAADANGGYATEGGFYGGDAQYLGGVYVSEEAQGTYGAMQDGASETPTDPTDSPQSNEPEAGKSGVQTLNVNVAPLNQVFTTTTRDFDADENSVVARADIASNELLGQLSITASGDADSNVAGSNGFKAHDDNTTVGALGQELPLSYTSVYKDFSDVLRIGHIDGKAVFSGVELPVNGAAVIGNATKVENMPTEGSVNYAGDATYRKLGIGNEIEFGTSAFTADFVAKKLKGDLSFASAGDIALSAEIDGNKFSSAADANGGYATEGGFYGGDADYLGGIYLGKGAQGTFGAEKK